jgi:hypothetical protein
MSWRDLQWHRDSTWRSLSAEYRGHYYKITRTFEPEPLWTLMIRYPGHLHFQIDIYKFKRDAKKAAAKHASTLEVAAA